jgi:hypothetical protein
MASLEERVRASSRRGSAVSVTSNPLEEKSAVSTGQLKVVRLADAKPIEPAELTELLNSLKNIRYH